MNNTVRNMLFLPCTRDQKYGGKQVIDSFFVRIGTCCRPCWYSPGPRTSALGGGGFAKMNIVIVTGWLALAFFVGREYTRLASTGSQPGSRLVGSRRGDGSRAHGPGPG